MHKLIRKQDLLKIHYIKNTPYDVLIFEEIFKKCEK